MIERNHDIDLNECLYRAASHGRIDMIDRMIELGADDINEALYSAVLDQEFDAAEHLSGLGIINWNRGLLYSTEHNDVRGVLYYIDHGATNLNEALAEHIERDAEYEIVTTLIYLGADDIDLMMVAAIDIADMQLISRAVIAGFSAWDQALMHATWNNAYFLVEYCLIKGATQLNAPLIAAAELGYLDVTKLLYSSGEFTLDFINDVIVTAETQDIIDYLEVQTGQKTM